MNEKAGHLRRVLVLLAVGLAPFKARPDIRAEDGHRGRPNILFIMSDDHAAHAIGAYGGRLAVLDPTPTLDRLAREGARLTNVFCTNSICTPSRATIMTGQYSHVNGVTTLNGAIPPDRQYLARLMGQAGYETAMVGKWHLKDEPAAFDFYTVLPGQGSYFNPAWIKPGTVIDAIINNVDFAPTLLAMAGVATPDFMQGRSFLPMLRGEPTPADWPDATYYRYWMHMAHHDNPAHYGIRTKDFKLIFFYGLPLDAPGAVQSPTEPYWELYDLRTDPHEMHNVIAEPAYAEVVKRLKARLAMLKSQVGDTDERYPELLRLAQ